MADREARSPARPCSKDERLCYYRRLEYDFLALLPCFLLFLFFSALSCCVFSSSCLVTAAAICSSSRRQQQQQTTTTTTARRGHCYIFLHVTPNKRQHKKSRPPLVVRPWKTDQLGCVWFPFGKALRSAGGLRRLLLGQCSSHLLLFNKTATTTTTARRGHSVIFFDMSHQTRDNTKNHALVVRSWKTDQLGCVWFPCGKALRSAGGFRRPLRSLTRKNRTNCDEADREAYEFRCKLTTCKCQELHVPGYQPGRRMQYLARKVYAKKAKKFRNVPQQIISSFYEGYMASVHRMVIENRPVDPGSIQGSHRPISFIRIKHRTRADDILYKTEY